MATYVSLRRGCTFHPFDDGERSQEYIVRTPDSRQFKISAAAYKLLHDLDEGASLEEIYGQLSLQQPAVTYPDFQEFVLGQYGPMLETALGSGAVSNAHKKSGVGLLISHTLVPAAIVMGIARRFSWIYSPGVATAAVIGIAAVHWALYTHGLPVFSRQVHPVVVLACCLFSVVAHEFGHAAAVARFGGRPGSIGAGLFILMPVMYADVSQVWTFRRKHRIVVDLGGICFQQIIFTLLGVGSLLFHDASLRAACVGIDVMTLIALNPVFRFDGYWVLVDWLGLPNLHAAARAYLKSLVSSIRKGTLLPALRPSVGHTDSKTVIFITYALLSNFLLTFAVFLNLRWIQSTVEGLLQQLPLLVNEAQISAHQHHWLRTLDITTGLGFVCASALTLLVGLILRGRQLTRAVARPKPSPERAS